MKSEDIKALLEKQRAYYRTGVTVPVEFRTAQLKKLYAAVKQYQTQISSALTADLGKSPYEGFMCESGLVLSEISYMLRHVRRSGGQQGHRAGAQADSLPHLHRLGLHDRRRRQLPLELLLPRHEKRLSDHR